MATRRPTSRASSQIERLARAEERVEALHNALESWRDEFRSHAKEISGALRALQDEHHRRIGAERERHWWTAAIVGTVTLVVNIVIKMI